ncbi:MAG TPA: hypothetical protein VKE94_16840, partial [Gemmataceae bacterium]|nr:hypothetical protein [Gemmataceae bacterium]
MMRFFAMASAALALTMPLSRAQQEQPKTLRVGMIGLDTSHVIAFTKLLNNPDNKGDLAGIRVVAGYPGGSKDIPDSATRVGKYTEELRDKYQIKIVDS